MEKILFEYILRDTRTDLWIGKGGCDPNPKYNDYFVVDEIPEKNSDLRKAFFYKVIFNHDLDSFFRTQFQESTAKEAIELKSEMELYLATGGIDLFRSYEDNIIEEDFLSEFYDPTHELFELPNTWIEARKKLQVNYEWVVSNNKLRRTRRNDKLIYSDSKDDFPELKRLGLVELKKFGKSRITQKELKLCFEQFLNGKIPDRIIVWSGTKRELAHLFYMLKKAKYVKNTNANIHYLIARYFILDLTTKNSKGYKSKLHFSENYMKNEFKTFGSTIDLNNELHLVYKNLCSKGILSNSKKEEEAKST